MFEIQARHNGSDAGRRFVETFAQVACERTEQRRRWINHLRKQGIKAAHPDDGWVDRKNDSVRLVYPDFNSGARVGDLIALGRHDDYRIVRLTAEMPPSPLGFSSPHFTFANPKEQDDA